MIKNKKLFENIVCKSQKELKVFLEKELRNRAYHPQIEDGYIYAAGSIPVLLVAHMDTVHPTTVKNICWDSKNKMVMSPEGIGGDDRCGIYMILQLIKDHKCHVLFTEDEETGGRGATKFTKDNIRPLVNYIIEFDRKGNNDAVFYDCDNVEFKDFICSYGLQEEWGSFSDISIIAPVLKVSAVNISCGYYNAHTQHEYVRADEMERNIELAASIVEDHDVFYEYIEDKYSFRRYGNYYSYNASWDEDYDEYSGWRESYTGYGYTDRGKNSRSYSFYDEKGNFYEEGYEVKDEPYWSREVELMPLKSYNIIKVYDERTGEYISSEKGECDYYAIDRHGDLYIIDENNFATYFGDVKVLSKRKKPILFNRSMAKKFTWIG